MICCNAGVQPLSAVAHLKSVTPSPAAIAAELASLSTDSTNSSSNSNNNNNNSSSTGITSSNSSSSTSSKGQHQNQQQESSASMMSLPLTSGRALAIAYLQYLVAATGGVSASSSCSSTIGHSSGHSTMAARGRQVRIHNEYHRCYISLIDDHATRAFEEDRTPCDVPVCCTERRSATPPESSGRAHPPLS